VLLGLLKTLGELDGETKDTCKSKEELPTMPESVESILILSNPHTENNDLFNF
jgi:hypothetical protein